MKTLDDIELIKDFDEVMGQEYERAKCLYKSAPIQTLIILRSLATSITTLMLSEVGEEKRDSDLYDLVEKLHSTKLINKDIIKYLHQIRLEGNKAAHPEQFSLKETDFRELARNTLLVLCDTVDLIRTSFQGLQPTQYEFIESNETELENLTYKALFKNDSQAKYDVAIALIQQRNQRWEQTFNNTTNQSFVYFSEEDGDELRNALHFLESTSNWAHSDSRFTLGLTYIKGLGCEVNMHKGISHLSFAAYSDHDEAKAYYGYFLLELDDKDEEDIREALRFLDESAQKRHPLALNTLSKVYADGKLVKKDLLRSMELLTEAANSGYPESQYKLAEFYLREGEFDNYWVYIEQSLSNGYVPALLSAGRTLVRQPHNKEQLVEALSCYSRYVEISNDPVARYEFGLLILKHAGENPIEIKKGLGEFIASYRSSDCPIKIRKEIENLTPKHLRALDRLFAKMSLTKKEEDDWTAFYCNFDSKGCPFDSQKSMLDSISALSNSLQTSSAQDIKNNVKSRFYMPSRVNTSSTRNLTHQKIGRNDVCPLCNSGKKYKHCCDR